MKENQETVNGDRSFHQNLVMVQTETILETFQEVLGLTNSDIQESPLSKKQKETAFIWVY